jgi:hypothetical protein
MRMAIQIILSISVFEWVLERVSEFAILTLNIGQPDMQIYETIIVMILPITK